MMLGSDEKGAVRAVDAVSQMNKPLGRHDYALFVGDEITQIHRHVEKTVRGPLSSLEQILQRERNIMSMANW